MGASRLKMNAGLTLRQRPSARVARAGVTTTYAHGRRATDQVGADRVGKHIDGAHVKSALHSNADGTGIEP